jgi:lysine 2,3-aminomutase
MDNSNNIFYTPRKYNTIELWKNVSEKQWNDPGWQIKNSIKSVEQLKKIIKLSDHQVQEIDRTLKTLKKQGKEPLRITPYYASLMQADPFNPVLMQG